MRTKQENMKISKESRIRTISPAMAGIFGVIGFVGLSLSGINAFAETFEAEQGLSFTLNSSVAVSITGGTGSGSDGLTIEDLVPGDYKDSNIITVTASSNNVSGYTLSSSVGSSTYASTELRRNGTETANKFTSLTENKASLSAFDPGFWGYSYSTDSGSTWISGDIVSGTSSGYNGLPIYTTTTPIKLINSSTASSSSIQFKIGAKATSSQVSGAYTNIINFIGVGKVITTNYAITFSDPSGEASGMPSQQTGTTDSGAVQLPSTVPTRTNYMFKGWCTIQVADGGECTGTGATQIQPSGFLALNAGTSPSNPEERTLYAMWKSNSPAPSKTYMQNLPSSSCTTTATTVYDNRDEEEYLIQRLADGNCWMLDNLRLGGSSAMDLTPSDTNINSNWTLPASGTTCFVSGTCTGSDGTTTGTGYTVAAINADSKNTTVTSYGAGSGKVGNYYNYCAASGGTYCYASGSGTGDAQYDICPAGWRMPTGGDYQGSGVGDGEYFALGTALGLTFDEDWWGFTGTTYQTALSTPLSGCFYGGSAGSQGDGGGFWSSTRYNGSGMYSLDVSSDGAYPANLNSRFYGYSLRCILDS